jgi:spore maturation protein SpmA
MKGVAVFDMEMHSTPIVKANLDMRPKIIEIAGFVRTFSKLLRPFWVDLFEAQIRTRNINRRVLETIQADTGGADLAPPC